MHAPSRQTCSTAASLSFGHSLVCTMCITSWQPAALLPFTLDFGAALCACTQPSKPTALLHLFHLDTASCALCASLAGNLQHCCFSHWRLVLHRVHAPSVLQRLLLLLHLDTASCALRASLASPCTLLFALCARVQPANLRQLMLLTLYNGCCCQHKAVRADVLEAVTAAMLSVPPAVAHHKAATAVVCKEVNHLDLISHCCHHRRAASCCQHKAARVAVHEAVTTTINSVQPFAVYPK